MRADGVTTACHGPQMSGGGLMPSAFLGKTHVLTECAAAMMWSSQPAAEITAMRMGASRVLPKMCRRLGFEAEPGAAAAWSAANPCTWRSAKLHARQAAYRQRFKCYDT